MGNSSLTNQALLEAETLFQQKLTDCMAAEGFEHISRDLTARIANTEEYDSSRADIISAFPNMEEAEETGFGIATETLSYMNHDPPVDAVSLDPNDEIREALSDAELDAYLAALSGCEALAETASGVADIYVVTDQAHDLSIEVGERLFASPVFFEINREWASCYANKSSYGGVPVSLPFELLDVLYEEAEVALIAATGTAIPSDHPEWSAFAARERAVAVDVLQCMESVEYATRFGVIRNEIVEDVLDS